jgi:hypothetical protein
MARKRPESDRPAREPARPATLGPARYTVERYLSDCSPRSAAYLRENWGEGNQLFAEEVPTDALPCVVIFACYARQYEVELVDDYTRLLDRYWDEIKEFAHPDKFFSSSIVIMDETGATPTLEAFESINIPNLYEELLP